jgi:hypothetical protein
MVDPVLNPVVECHSFTMARRHPEVVGKIGRTVLPFQLTAPALLSGTVVFAVLVLWWRSFPWPFGPILTAVVMVVGPCVAGRAAQVHQVGGRSPLGAAGGVVRYVCRSRTGVVAGRPVRRPAVSLRPRRLVRADRSVIGVRGGGL